MNVPDFVPCESGQRETFGSVKQRDPLELVRVRACRLEQVAREERVRRRGREDRERCPFDTAGVSRHFVNVGAREVLGDVRFECVVVARKKRLIARAPFDAGPRLIVEGNEAILHRTARKAAGVKDERPVA